MVRRPPNANLIIYGDAGHAFLFQHAEAFGRQVLDGELIDEGVVQQLLLRAEQAGGNMVVDAESAEAAHDRLSTLPFIKAGVMQIELVELKQ
jgi:hypothetical protein